MKKVVYPGSFDPVTLGHLNVIDRLSRTFDEVIVLVAESVRKSYMFSSSERAEFLRTEARRWTNVKVDVYQGMTIDYAKKVGAPILVRSIRHLNDWELEVTMAHANRKLAPEIDTLFVVPEPNLAHVSSSLVREVAVNHGELESFVSPNVKKALIEKIREIDNRKND